MRCAATGMSASITFHPDGTVRGAASRLQGQGTARVAAIDGRWTDVVEVTAPEWEARGGWCFYPLATSRFSVISPRQCHGHRHPAHRQDQVLTTLLQVSNCCRHCRDAGVLFDGSELRPPPVHSLRLPRLEPMWMPHVWSAVRDALLSATAGSSTNKVGTHGRCLSIRCKRTDARG